MEVNGQTTQVELADWGASRAARFPRTFKQPLDTRTLLKAALANDVAFMPVSRSFPTRIATWSPAAEFQPH